MYETNALDATRLFHFMRGAGLHLSGVAHKPGMSGEEWERLCRDKAAAFGDGTVRVETEENGLIRVIVEVNDATE